MLLRKIDAIAIFAWFLLAWLPQARAEGQQVYFVINAHGAKTMRDFIIPTSVSVYTPADPSRAYSYLDDAADPKGIENIFAAGRLPAYDRASAKDSWQRFTAGHWAKMPDVLLTPLNFDTDLFGSETGTTRELKYLTENMNHRPQHWAYETGADAVLFVRRSSGIERILGHQAVKKFINANSVPAASYVELDAPIILVVPRQNKVKVLGRTSLSEVVELIHMVFATGSAVSIQILMAACNEEATTSSKRIVLATDAARAISISQLFPN